MSPSSSPGNPTTNPIEVRVVGLKVVEVKLREQSEYEVKHNWDRIIDSIVLEGGLEIVPTGEYCYDSWLDVYEPEEG